MFMFRVCVLSCFSCVLLFATLWNAACQATLCMGFSRQEDWSGLLWTSRGDLWKFGLVSIFLFKSLALTVSDNELNICQKSLSYNKHTEEEIFEKNKIYVYVCVCDWKLTMFNRPERRKQTRSHSVQPGNPCFRRLNWQVMGDKDGIKNTPNTWGSPSQSKRDKKFNKYNFCNPSKRDHQAAKNHWAAEKMLHQEVSWHWPEKLKSNLMVPCPSS